jgi:hypothetical protein
MPDLVRHGKHLGGDAYSYRRRDMLAHRAATNRAGRGANRAAHLAGVSLAVLPAIASNAISTWTVSCRKAAGAARRSARTSVSHTADQVLVGHLGVLDAREEVDPEIHVVLQVLRIDRRTYPPGDREYPGIVRERIGELAIAVRPAVKRGQLNLGSGRRHGPIEQRDARPRIVPYPTFSAAAKLVFVRADGAPPFRPEAQRITSGGNLAGGHIDAARR